MFAYQFFLDTPPGHLKLQTDSYEKWVEVRFALGFTYLNKKQTKLLIINVF